MNGVFFSEKKDSLICTTVQLKKDMFAVDVLLPDLLQKRVIYVRLVIQL